MIYGDIINSSYDELREKFPRFQSLSPEQKVVAMYNGNDIESYSNNSDIIVYYDILNADRPLLVVERVPDSEFESAEQLEEFVKETNELIEDYVVAYAVVEDKEYVDISLTRNRLYENIIKQGV